MITLATYAVLKGYGVGDGSASAIAATLNWMLKGIYYMLFQIDANVLTICIKKMERGCLD